MNIGFVGLGKLGLPCALAIEGKGHTIYGTDTNQDVIKNIVFKQIPYKEEGAQKALTNAEHLYLSELPAIVEKSDIIFVPIQTPHQPEYEGCVRIPDDRIDFDYTWLKAGVKELSDEIGKQGVDKIVVIISTVLPGTIEREIKPLLSDHVKLCYNPFFIAMGTCMQDFLHPEFILMGVDDEYAAQKTTEFYATITDAPVQQMSIASAELAKVAYNTYIGQKIVFINAMMEICHKTGANVDDITRAIRSANKRIISPAYLEGGMGDGGGCHPRDNIALSWLARKLNLSYDLFESVMECREKQTEWIASMAFDEASARELPIVILGKSFKPESNIETGSPAHLLRNIITEIDPNQPKMWDPHIDGLELSREIMFTPAVFVIATKHKYFGSLGFPTGSVVIDPWRYIQDQDGVDVIRLGE